MTSVSKRKPATWSSKLFAFYLDYSDKITSVYTGEVTDDGRDIIRSENRNKVEIYGSKQACTGLSPAT